MERLADNKLLTTSLILRALCLGNFTFLLPALALQARIPSRNVRLLIADESGRGAGAPVRALRLRAEAEGACSSA